METSTESCGRLASGHPTQRFFLCLKCGSIRYWHSRINNSVNTPGRGSDIFWKGLALDRLSDPRCGCLVCCNVAAAVNGDWCLPTWSTWVLVFAALCGRSTLYPIIEAQNVCITGRILVNRSNYNMHACMCTVVCGLLENKQTDRQTVRRTQTNAQGDKQTGE